MVQKKNHIDSLELILILRSKSSFLGDSSVELFLRKKNCHIDSSGLLLIPRSPQSSHLWNPCLYLEIRFFVSIFWNSPPKNLNIRQNRIFNSTFKFKHKIENIVIEKYTFKILRNGQIGKNISIYTDTYETWIRLT